MNSLIPLCIAVYYLKPDSTITRVEQTTYHTSLSGHTQHSITWRVGGRELYPRHVSDSSHSIRTALKVLTPFSQGKAGCQQLVFGALPLNFDTVIGLPLVFSFCHPNLYLADYSIIQFMVYDSNPALRL